MTYAEFQVSANVRIRDCTRGDLPSLEWWGWLASERQQIREAFAAHERGTGVFLVADSQDFPVGQVRIDFEREKHQNRAFIWAVRLIPGLRGAGIGTRLIETAEELCRKRGFMGVEISVEKDNLDALRLYADLGYEIDRDCNENNCEQWVLAKEVA